MRYFLIAASIIVAIVLGATLLWIKSRGGVDGVLEGYRDFSLSGQVVDSRGAPINGVTIWANAGRRYGFGTKIDYEDESHRDQPSRFSLRFKARSSVSLTFIKDGYDSTRRDFHSDDPVRQNLRIVLFTEAEAAAQAAAEAAATRSATRKAPPN